MAKCELKYRQAVAKYIRKADPLLKKTLNQKVEEIANNPHSAYKLCGEFKDLLSHHFTHRGVDYRIIYEIFPQNLIVVELIGPRENIYEKLRRIR